HVLTGFPWNEIGQALATDLRGMQAAAVIGLYGLNLLAVLIFAAPAVLVGVKRTRGRGEHAFFTLALLLFAGLQLAGLIRLSWASDATVPGLRLRLVQPDIAQADKWRPHMREGIINILVDLSRRPAADGAPGLSAHTLLIWPESVFPFLVQFEPQVLGRIGALLPQGAILVAGAARAGEATPGRAEVPIYNSVLAFND